MDYIYLLGLIVALFYLVSIALMFYADSDLITFFYARYGKDPKETYKNKVVWLTGASSGIGEALAKELASYGAKLVLSARRKEELERVKKECLQLKGAPKSDDILVLPLDVTDMNAHQGALDTVLKKFGKLHTFVSNAGQFQRGDFTKQDLSVDRHIFEINVFAVVNMNRLVVKHFLKNGGGQIAVVSSLAGKVAGPFSASYAASKHAIQGYFNSLRMETMGKNIDVTLICPGPVATPIFSLAMGSNTGEITHDTHTEEMLLMSAERCAYLALVSMANGLKESWLSRLPVVPVVYLFTYHPLTFNLLSLAMKKRIAKERSQY